MRVRLHVQEIALFDRQGQVTTLKQMRRPGRGRAMSAASRRAICPRYETTLQNDHAQHEANPPDGNSDDQASPCLAARNGPAGDPRQSVRGLRQS